MPTEYDLIVRSKEKNMSEEEYLSLRGQYDTKLDEYGRKTKKMILVFLWVFAASFVLLYLRLFLTNNADYLAACSILLVEAIMVIFLYDPKEEEAKKTTYEKDRGILLNAQKNKLTAAKIRFGLVIGFGALFSLLNLIWWAILGFVPPGEPGVGSTLSIGHSAPLAAAIPHFLTVVDYDNIRSEIGEENVEEVEEVEEVEVEEIEEVEEKTDTDAIDEIDEIDAIDAIIDNSVIFRIGSPKALIWGEGAYIDEDSRYLAPFIGEAGRTFVPVRFIAETLGYEVGFNFGSESQKIIIYEETPDGKNILLSMFIGENFLEAGELIVALDAAPVLRPGGRTFIPARPFAESLGLKVYYAQSERIIIITGEDLEDVDAVAKKAADSLPVWPLDMTKVLKEWKNWPTNPDGGYHAGADFAIPEGNEVYAVYSGSVEDVLDLGSSSYGRYIVIKSTIGERTRYIYYAHLSRQAVKKGDSVRAGDIIGLTGSTGNSTGPHLHYEVRDEDRTYGSLGSPGLNPYDYLP